MVKIELNTKEQSDRYHDFVEDVERDLTIGDVGIDSIGWVHEDVFLVIDNKFINAGNWSELKYVEVDGVVYVLDEICEGVAYKLDITSEELTKQIQALFS